MRAQAVMNYLQDTLLVFSCGAPHFARSAKEIALKFMVHILFSFVGSPLRLIQNRTPVLIFIPSL